MLLVLSLLGIIYGFLSPDFGWNPQSLVLIVSLIVGLVVSLLAWLLLGPVRVAAADGSPLPALAETILAMVMIGGLEGRPDPRRVGA